jgi:hypothetical protein
MNELLDIATLHTSGEEAVRVVFIQRDGITVPGSSWGHRPKPLTMALREVPKEAKGAKAAPPMTRKQKAPMRSMLLSLSMISGSRHDSKMKQPVQTMHTLSSTSSKSAP